MSISTHKCLFNSEESMHTPLNLLCNMMKIAHKRPKHLLLDNEIVINYNILILINNDISGSIRIMIVFFIF